MANLKVTIKEDIVLNGTQQGGVYSKTYDNITDVYKRIFYATQDVETNLYTTATTVTEGNILDKDSVKYVRITNLDSAVSIGVQLTNADNDVNWTKVSPGASFQLSSHASSSDAAATVNPYGTLAWDDITRVDVAGVSGSARVELFAASTVNG